MTNRLPERKTRLPGKPLKPIRPDRPERAQDQCPSGVEGPPAS